MDLRGKPFYLTAEEETWVYECLAAMDERTKTGSSSASWAGTIR